MLRRDKIPLEPLDPDAVASDFFTLAAAWLKLVSDAKDPRSVIAKWVRAHGLARTMGAVAQAARLAPAEAISFTTKCLTAGDEPKKQVSKADRLAYVAWSVKGHYHSLSNQMITPAEIKECIETGLLTKEQAENY